MSIFDGSLETPQSLLHLIKKSVASYNAMTPEDRAKHDYAQKRSFVRGMCPSHRNYQEWCKIVDSILPANGESK